MAMTRIQALVAVADLARRYDDDAELRAALLELTTIEARDKARFAERLAAQGRPCATCGRTFLPLPSDVFCSIGCRE